MTSKAFRDRAYLGLGEAGERNDKCPDNTNWVNVVDESDESHVTKCFEIPNLDMIDLSIRDFN